MQAETKQAEQRHSPDKEHATFNCNISILGETRVLENQDVFISSILQLSHYYNLTQYLARLMNRKMKQIRQSLPSVGRKNHAVMSYWEHLQIRT